MCIEVFSIKPKLSEEYTNGCIGEGRTLFMEKKTVLGMMLALLLMGMLMLAFNIQPVKAEPRTWIVDDDGPADFHMIQEAINTANSGDTIYVKAGTYYENVVVNKTLTFVGEDKDITVIDGSGSENVVSLSASDVNISGFTIRQSGTEQWNSGIYVSSSNNNITSNVIENNQYGVWCWGAFDTIKGNKIAYNEISGIAFASSHNNTVACNNIIHNGGDGVFITSNSNGNTISNNTLSNNFGGLGVYSDYNNIRDHIIANNTLDGVSLDTCCYNDILNNFLSGNERGISLLHEVRYNTIVANTITDNQEGIEFFHSDNNVFYHNNFINNTVQVYSQSSTNIWDDGYPSGGNYWSDYVGVDVKSGPNQDLLGSDSIGDTPYVIDENNTDYYPLMNPWSAVAGNLQILKPTNESVIMGPINITFTIENRGCDVEFARGDSSNRIDLEIEYRSTGGELYGWGITFWSTSYDGLVLHSGDKYAQTVFYDPSEFEKAVPPDFIGDAPYGKATIRLVHWKRMDEGYGYGEFGVTEINVILILPPLSASISPLSASILVGQLVTFTSTISGGYTPYGYQWYLNGNPVSGATAASWTFTPTTSGIYYVHLKVTDAKGNTAQSDTARITVTTVPVGGYSFPIQVQTKTEPIIPYIALIATLTAILTKLRPKTKRKH